MELLSERRASLLDDVEMFIGRQAIMKRVTMNSTNTPGALKVLLDHIDRLTLWDRAVIAYISLVFIAKKNARKFHPDLEEARIIYFNFFLIRVVVSNATPTRSVTREPPKLVHKSISL